MAKRKIEKTTAPVERGKLNGVAQEFGRVADVKQVYGLKRGTTYNLLRQRKIRGVLLRVCGQKSGVRLFDMGSIRDFIESEMRASSQVNGGAQ
jgi:hypothetical protein